MYKDWSYFVKEAEKIANEYGVKYSRVTSGYNKGEYTSKLVVDIDVSEGESYAEQIEKLFGCELKYYSQYGRPEKDATRRDLIKEMALSLSSCDKRKFKQPMSDVFIYFNDNYEYKKEDIYFASEIGGELYDYFQILNNRINSEDWKDNHQLKTTLTIGIGDVLNFKEFYYLIKGNAKKYWLKQTDRYKLRNTNKLETFVFDEENIPEITEIEGRLDGKTENKVVAIENINEDISKLIEIDLSNLKNGGHIKVGYRKKEFLETAIILGRERDIILPANIKHNSYFAIVDIDNIIASHNEKSFATSENYPTNSDGRNVNDRNYTSDKNAQMKVVSVAQNLDTELSITTSPTSSGTPIISVDGIVVSGNNRTMSLKLAKTDYPENYEKYIKTLQSEFYWGGYGIDVNVINQILMGEEIILKGSSYNQRKSVKIKNPILVRIDIDFPEYTMGELNNYNKSTKKSEREIDMAIRLSQQLQENEGCKNLLVELISSLDIVSELYNDANYVSKYKKILLGCNIITENDIAAMFTASSLTETGKILYETILLSLVLDAKSIEVSQNTGIKSFTNNVVNAIIPLIKNKSLPDGSLIGEVNNAMLIQNDMINSKYKDLPQYVTERELFEAKDNHKTDKSIIINSFIRSSKDAFKKVLINYNNSVSQNAGADMFGDALSPNDVFELVFTKNTDTNLIKALGLRVQEEKNNIPLYVADQQTDIKVENQEIDMAEILKRASKYL